MDIVTLLIEDHQKMKAELAIISQDVDSPNTRERTRRFIAHYEAHESIEENILFPALKLLLNENSDGEWLTDLMSDHREMWTMMDHMVDSLNDKEIGLVRDEVITFQRFFQLHLHEEENILFPGVKKMLEPKMLQKLGEEAQIFLQKYEFGSEPRTPA